MCCETIIKIHKRNVLIIFVLCKNHVILKKECVFLKYVLLLFWYYMRQNNLKSIILRLTIIQRNLFINLEHSY